MTSPLVQVPVESGNEAFFDAAEQGQLVIQGCSDCYRLRFPPRPVCPWCRSMAYDWRAMSGRGRIWSFAVPHPPLLPPFEQRAPYNVVVVALDDDPMIRLVGNVVHADDSGLRFVSPGDLHIDAEVQVTFPRVPNEPRLPRWTLVS